MNPAYDNISVEEMIEQGAVQISSKYRMIGFLPKGVSALDALAEANPVKFIELLARFESDTASAFLNSATAKEKGYVRELTAQQWSEWRKSAEDYRKNSMFRKIYRESLKEIEKFRPLSSVEKYIVNEKV